MAADPVMKNVVGALIRAEMSKQGVSHSVIDQYLGLTTPSAETQAEQDKLKTTQLQNDNSVLTEEQKALDIQSKQTAAEKANAPDNLRTDVLGGKGDPTLLQDMMSKYSTKMKPEDVLRIYNTNSPFGPAKEDSGTLNSKYGVPLTAAQQKALDIKNNPSSQPLTAAQSARKDALLQALSSLEGADVNLTAAGGAKGPSGIAATIPFIGQYLDPEGAAYHNTKVEIATQLAKAITGGSRPPANVIEKYLDSLPDIHDNPQYAKSKAQKLKNEILQQAKAFKFQDILDQYGEPVKGSDKKSGGSTTGGKDPLNLGL